MRRLLLDTNALLWLSGGSARLGSKARTAILAAIDKDENSKMPLLIGMSIRRYLPPMGTAGLERERVSGKRRVPRPPPRMVAMTWFMMMQSIIPRPTLIGSSRDG